MEDVLKRLIFETALKAAMSQLIKAVPFFGLPFVNPIVTWIVTKVAEMVYDELAKVVEFSVIDLKTDFQRRVYEKSVEELRKTQQNPASTPEDLRKAHEEFKKRLRDLIRFP